MEAATPLILTLLAIVLFIATGEQEANQYEQAEKDKSEGVKPQTPSSGSRIFAQIIATLLLVAGIGTLVYRRMTGGGATGGGNTWAEVLTDALGPSTAKVAGLLLRHGLWGVLVIAAVLAIVFTVGIAPPQSPLAWIAYAAVGVLGLIAVFTSPVVAEVRGATRLGKLFKWLWGKVTTWRAIAIILVAALAIGLLALGNIYPLVGWAVFAAISFFLGAYVYQNIGEWAPGLVAMLKGIKRRLANLVGLGKPLDPNRDFTKEEIDEMARSDIRSQVGSVAVVSAGLIALGVYLPTIWRKLPSLRLGGNIGTELLGRAIPFATSKSFEVPGGATGSLGSQGTAEYTIGWWQFINTRASSEAIPALELGPVGQMLIGPGPTTVTLALNSPVPMDAVHKLTVKIKPQRWQQLVLRASGNRTDVFVDGELVGSSMHPPASVRVGDIFTMPGTPPQKTQGGITKLTYSSHAEPYGSILLAAHSLPPEAASN
jgi:hypothetical protein